MSDVINYQVNKSEFEAWYKEMYGQEADYEHSINMNMIVQSYIAKGQIYQLRDANDENRALKLLLSDIKIDDRGLFTEMLTDKWIDKRRELLAPEPPKQNQEEVSGE